MQAMLLRRQSFAKCNKPPRPRPPPPGSLWRGATSPTSSSRTSFFLSLVAISYSLDLSPAGLTIVLSHQEELISSPSIPRVFSQPFHRSQESPSLFQIYFTRCIQSPRQARKSHNLRQEPLSTSTSEDSPYSRLEQIFTKLTALLLCRSTLLPWR